MKYNSGDKIQVRADLIEGEQYGVEYFVGSDMGKVLGKVCTIEDVSDGENVYRLVEDYYKWRWTDEMFEEGVVISE